MDELLELASASFPVEIVESIKKAQFTIEDLAQLTRADVDHEFRGYRFGIRKSIWTFLSNFSPTKEEGELAIETSTEVEISRPIGQMDVAIATSSDTTENHTFGQDVCSNPRETLKSQVALCEHTGNDERAVSKLHMDTEALDPKSQYGVPGMSSKGTVVARENITLSPRVESKLAGTACTEKNPDACAEIASRPTKSPDEGPHVYMDCIPAPFPLSDNSRTFLLKDKKQVMKDEVKLRRVIREVCDIMCGYLGRKPSLAEVEDFKRKFCEEYPSLACDNSNPYTFNRFYNRLQKRLTTLSAGQNTDVGIKSDSSLGDHSMKEEIWHCSDPGPAERVLSLQESYPGDIPAPFPLSDCSKKILRNDKESLVKNEHRFNFLVREVADVLWSGLQRKPTVEEIRLVDRNLCLEYPVLRSHRGLVDSLFYQRLRKRIIGRTRR